MSKEELLNGEKKIVPDKHRLMTLKNFKPFSSHEKLDKMHNSPSIEKLSSDSYIEENENIDPKNNGIINGNREINIDVDLNKEKNGGRKIDANEIENVNNKNILTNEERNVNKSENNVSSTNMESFNENSKSKQNNSNKMNLKMANNLNISMNDLNSISKNNDSNNNLNIVLNDNNNENNKKSSPQSNNNLNKPLNDPNGITTNEINNVNIKKQSPIPSNLANIPSKNDKSSPITNNTDNIKKQRTTKKEIKINGKIYSTSSSSNNISGNKESLKKKKPKSKKKKNIIQKQIFSNTPILFSSLNGEQHLEEISLKLCEQMDGAHLIYHAKKNKTNKLINSDYFYLDLHNFNFHFGDRTKVLVDLHAKKDSSESEVQEVEIDLLDFSLKYRNNKEIVEETKKLMEDSLQNFLSKHNYTLKVTYNTNINYKKIRITKLSMSFGIISFQIHLPFSLRKKIREEQKFSEEFSELLCAIFRKILMFKLPDFPKKLVSFSKEVKIFDGNPQLYLFKSRKYYKKLSKYNSSFQDKQKDNNYIELNLKNNNNNNNTSSKNKNKSPKVIKRNRNPSNDDVLRRNVYMQKKNKFLTTKDTNKRLSANFLSPLPSPHSGSEDDDDSSSSSFENHYHHFKNNRNFSPLSISPRNRKASPVSSPRSSTSSIDISPRSFSNNYYNFSINNSIHKHQNLKGRAILSEGEDHLDEDEILNNFISQENDSLDEFRVDIKLDEQEVTDSGDEKEDVKSKKTSTKSKKDNVDISSQNLAFFSLDQN